MAKRGAPSDAAGSVSSTSPDPARGWEAVAKEIVRRRGGTHYCELHEKARCRWCESLEAAITAALAAQYAAGQAAERVRYVEPRP